ncbi:nuclear transport factor 2 family protein [Actinomadura sp. KC216]|uniref:nuclear transport factor 2 family protein n=1 Tax=Actinomadura sp. KC216 TaxID=2530370 RepID=UPI0010514ED3|nr:nuclear transport factor 2 family protein [Actinomadura sp. KC216]TDB79930.1 nuclear transport factor 2 family protein [Actinomadura sp. KC216]
MAHDDIIRAFYTARSTSDTKALRALLTPDVRWHEPGDEDYSGTHEGRETVLKLLEDLHQATNGTFTLRPTGFLTTDEHVVAKIRWSATRGETHVAGNEIAIYRITEGKIAEAWFHVDGYDPDALSEVFALR